MIPHNIHRELVLEIIKRYASEDNPITPTKILETIEKEYPDYACDRKTIRSALDYLRETYGSTKDGKWLNDKFCLHYDEFQRTTSIKRSNYWLEIKPDDDSFSDDELLFLIDAVQFSKHISYKYADSIIKKLIRLSDNSFSDKFESYKNIDRDYHTVRPDFFLKIGDINRAIHQHKKISFFINQYGVDKLLHPISKEPQIISPYRIVTSDGNYYVIGREDSSPNIKSFRIDRITDVDVLTEGYASSPEMGKIKSHPEVYLAEHRYMGNGKPVEVTLSIERHLLGEVIDSFGTGIIIEPAKETSNSLTVHVKSNSIDIVNWALRFIDYVEILAPKKARLELTRRITQLTFRYHRENQDKYYREQIARAKESGHLILNFIDLNNHYSFKKLKDIESVMFKRNRLTDFSFLLSYPKLNSICIDNNTIKEPSILSKLRNLDTLFLGDTGITNLDFLKGLDKLTFVILNEHTLENIDGIYTLPNLQELLVDSTTAELIDVERLEELHKDAYFHFEIDDS